MLTGSHYFANHKPFPICVAAAFLRIGKKYDLKQLYHEAFSRLQYRFPSELEEWDNDFDHHSINEQPGVAFDAINLLREVDIPLLLPVAFYMVCEDVEFGVDDILGGIRRRDGSLALLATEDSRILL
jgi:hypothetical protein